MAKQKTRQQRWDEALGELEAAQTHLEDVWYEFHEWEANLPENLRESALGEKLDYIVNDLDVEGIRSIIDECYQADLPTGFGRD